MASTSAVLLLLFAGLFTVKAGDDCKSYYSGNEHKPGITCEYQEHCCGSCNNRYCCSREDKKLSDHDQDICNIGKLESNGGSAIGSVITSILVLIIVFLTCWFCPCCCIYKTCRKPRTVAGTHVTTVVTNTNVIQQQPAVQAIQYLPYQPVPTQPGYGQPMQMAPYQGQPCAPGAPPSYNVAASPEYPTSHGAYDKGQAMYPTQPPVQSGPAYTPSETSSQPAYNPADVQPPNTASPGYPTSQSA